MACKAEKGIYLGAKSNYSIAEHRNVGVGGVVVLRPQQRSVTPSRFQEPICQAVFYDM
jgi:hypothetical protein